MPWWTWLCLGIFLLALVATAVFSVFAFTRVKRLAASTAGLQARLEEVSALAEEVQRKQVRVQSHLEELERHRAQAEASFARLRVLTSAFSEATGHPRRLKKRYLSK